MKTTPQARHARFNLTREAREHPQMNTINGLQLPKAAQARHIKTPAAALRALHLIRARKIHQELQ